MSWPATAEDLARAQEDLAAAAPVPWSAPPGPFRVAGVALVSSRRAPGRGARGDPAWAAAALVEVGAAGLRELAVASVRGEVAAPFEAGLLALREGPLLEAALRALPAMPDVVLVQAAGRDHPRRAGLALMLGAVVGVPSVGVTSRPLLARGAPPPPARRATSPLVLGGEEVGVWLRTRGGARPVAVHAAWRTTAEVAAEVVLRATASARLPEPLRRALREARTTRAVEADGAAR